jgi:hypothetical protein
MKEYLFGVLLLGTFQGVLISMGSNVLLSCIMSYLFWGLMLMPMLRDIK